MPRLHKGYCVPSIPNRKTGQQFAGPFRVTDFSINANKTFEDEDSVAEFVLLGMKVALFY